MSHQEKYIISSKIFKEVTKEEEDKEDDQIEHIIWNSKDNVDSVVLACNIKGIKAPCCGKKNKKRGRKILIELRIGMGNVEN